MAECWRSTNAIFRFDSIAAVFAVVALTSCGGDSAGGFTSTSPTNAVQSDPMAVVEQMNEDSYLLTTNDEELYRVSAATGASVLLHEFPLGIEFLEPVDVVDNMVIATANDNTINGINATTGEFLWEYGLGRYDVFGDESTAICVNPICYAVGSGDELSALNVVNENLLWGFDLRSVSSNAIDEIGPAMSVGEDHVYIVGNFANIGASTLLVFDRHTGDIVERINLDGYRSSEAKQVGSTLLIPTWESLLAYDTDTWTPLWSTNFNGENNGLYRTYSLVVAGNVVAFSSAAETTGDDDLDKRFTVGVDINTGSIIWTVDSGDFSGLRFDPQSDGTNFYTAYTVYSSLGGFRQKKGYPMAIDAQTGSVLWKHDRLNVSYEPLAAAGHLFFHDAFVPSIFTGFDDYYSGFTGLNMNTGQVVMTAPGVRTIYSSTPTLVHNNKVYVARR